MIKQLRVTWIFQGLAGDGFHAKQSSWISACFTGYSAAPVSTITAGIYLFAKEESNCLMNQLSHGPEIVHSKHFFTGSAKSCLFESCSFLLDLTQCGTNSQCPMVQLPLAPVRQQDRGGSVPKRTNQGGLNLVSFYIDAFLTFHMHQLSLWACEITNIYEVVWGRNERKHNFKVSLWLYGLHYEKNQEWHKIGQGLFFLGVIFAVCSFFSQGKWFQALFCPNLSTDTTDKNSVEILKSALITKLVNAFLKQWASKWQAKQMSHHKQQHQKGISVTSTYQCWQFRKSLMCRQILQNTLWDFPTDFMYAMKVKTDCEIRDSDITLAISKMSWYSNF